MDYEDFCVMVLHAVLGRGCTVRTIDLIKRG